MVYGKLQMFLLEEDFSREEIVLYFCFFCCFFFNFMQKIDDQSLNDLR